MGDTKKYKYSELSKKSKRIAYSSYVIATPMPFDKEKFELIHSVDNLYHENGLKFITPILLKK